MFKVLVVEDDRDLRQLFARVLQRSGYETLEAGDGQQALEVLEREYVDVIISDIMMPVMDGIETCRALRRDPALKETMVVFLSALGEEEQQLAGFGAGADDYIPKPIKPKLLLSRIQAILKRVAADKPASLVIDRERHLVIRDGERIELPRKEFALLALLASSPGKLFSREAVSYTHLTLPTIA